jgi:hypothetical protein
LNLAETIGSQFRHSSGTPLVFITPAAARATEVANKLIKDRVAKKVVRRMTSLIIDLLLNSTPLIALMQQAKSRQRWLMMR